MTVRSKDANSRRGGNARTTRRRVSASKRAQPGIVKLGPELCLANIGDARRQLLALQNATQAATIDISAVTRVDTAGIQLLLACARTLRAKSITLNWRGQSAAISTAVNRLGVGSRLALPGDEE